jgi:hypothetical protein
MKTYEFTQAIQPRENECGKVKTIKGFTKAESPQEVFEAFSSKRSVVTNIKEVFDAKVEQSFAKAESIAAQVDKSIDFYVKSVFGEPRAYLIRETNPKMFQDLYGVHRKQTYSLCDLEKYANFGFTFNQTFEPNEFPSVIDNNKQER